ncbi:hypothetical protein VNI00_015421 [Paramarasmius palmivorus]|uniref:Uncharacterized protein n=1 Tax=Paramarasmius palmivorus TaxID=297713 RepID=A0AAW0BKF4_9AGAR
MSIILVTPPFGTRVYCLLFVIGATLASLLSLSITRLFPSIHAEMPETLPETQVSVPCSSVSHHARRHISKGHDKKHTPKHTKTVYLDEPKVVRVTLKKKIQAVQEPPPPYVLTDLPHPLPESHSPSPVEFTNPFAYKSSRLKRSRTLPYISYSVSPLDVLSDWPGCSAETVKSRSIKFQDDTSSTVSRKDRLKRTFSALHPVRVASAFGDLSSRAMESARFTFTFSPPAPYPNQTCDLENECTSFTIGGPFCETPELGFGVMITREVPVPEDELDAPQRHHMAALKKDIELEVDETKIDRCAVAKKARNLLGMPVPTHPALCEGW